MSKQQGSGGFGEGIKTVFYAVLIALTVRTFAYEPFNIPSGSMIPTLLIGDHLFVSKFSYGYSKYSFPFGLDLFDGRVMNTPPERGDVAVFKRPGAEHEDYIKRLIGLPGDRIQVVRGLLHINGKPVKRQRIEDYQYTNQTGNTFRTAQYIETLPNGKKHRILEELGDRGPVDHTPVFTVPPGHVFAMGDNRDNSRDSRDLRWVGFIPMENLVGRADMLFFSTDGTARWWELWNWPTATRFERLFNGID